MNTVKFRVELEGAGQTAAGFDQVAAAGKNAVSQVTAGKRDLDQYGQTARATAAALRQVPAQFTDIVTGLASGQSPLTVLLQQGGQLKDMFGGVGNAAQALGGYVAGLINPLTITAAAATSELIHVVGFPLFPLVVFRRPCVGIVPIFAVPGVSDVHRRRLFPSSDLGFLARCAAYRA
jgi:phage-related minor tail protein